MGAHGSTGVSVGGGVRVGQEQGLSSGPTTPVFVHLGKLGTVISAATLNSPSAVFSETPDPAGAEEVPVSSDFTSGKQEPISGKEDGMAPRS